jgi:hypothetical protein
MKTAAIGVALGITLAAALAAQAKTPAIRRTEARQRARIVQGCRSGQLSRGEVRRLECIQRDIRMDERLALADGRVSPAERRCIRAEQRCASRQIARFKHNGRTR